MTSAFATLPESLEVPSVPSVIAPGTQSVRYSAVIPAYNSAPVVAETIARTCRFFESIGESYEVIVVNDGSRDDTWNVIDQCARANANVVAINLLRNYGQHTAVLCGLRHSVGDYAITLDDDLQNPPEEIRHLIAKASEGYDLVFGQFRKKRHAWHRRIGTWLIGVLNTKIFGKPDDLVLTNFRMIRRDVIERMCGYRTNYPYIPGLALMFSSRRANVLVEHERRESGESQYSLFKILQLVLRILFSYSTYPLRTVSMIGGTVAAVSFAIGMTLLVRALLVRSEVLGWASIVVLLSFFNGTAMMCLAMLGEYTVRLLNQTSGQSDYHVREIVRQAR
jgi:glycosyltransferase involved in cell wall biosynthesis